MLMIKGFLSFHLILLSGLLLSTEVLSKKKHGNPAKDIVDMINKNRTSLHLPQLYDNPGLGCIALQYAAECKGNCTSNKTVSCQPMEDDFIQVFAPDCGVELPTFVTISTVIVGCRSNHLSPSEAFSELLFHDKHSISTLRNTTHTQVGVGFVGLTHKHHFFWCVLFSNGDRNSSFVLEDHGLGIKQKLGCFSGTNVTCSDKASGIGIQGGVFWSGFFGVFTSLFLHFVVLGDVGMLYI